MKNFKLSLVAATLLMAASAHAAEQPKASDLVGKYYGGINASVIDLDEDRVQNDIDFDLSFGLGLEAGYRYSETTEFRLSAVDYSVEYESNAEWTGNGNGISFDVLYFPTQQNYYFLGGLIVHLFYRFHTFFG